MHTFETVQWLPVSKEQAWAFFSSPVNLEKITPPSLSFRILTKNIPSKIYNGLIINYSVRPLFGIPMKWLTEIRNVAEPYRFTDVQLRGPYSFWEHNHTFTEKDGGTEMTDTIRYKLPFGWIGCLFHRMKIKAEIESIFKYRKEILLKTFKQ